MQDIQRSWRKHELHQRHGRSRHLRSRRVPEPVQLLRSDALAACDDELPCVPRERRPEQGVLHA